MWCCRALAASWWPNGSLVAPSPTLPPPTGSRGLRPGGVRIGCGRRRRAPGRCGAGVTVREPETITALLTTIGAPDTAATWARDRTHHREHTPGPRLPGFDDANHTRATHAAAAAAARAERALLILGDQVPENLTAVAALRSTHREVSLQELGQMMNPPMTKDAVAGRIRRLLALADRHARHTGIPDTTTALTPNTLTRP